MFELLTVRWADASSTSNRDPRFPCTWDSPGASGRCVQFLSFRPKARQNKYLTWRTYSSISMMTLCSEVLRCQSICHCIFYQWCSGNPGPETCLPPRGSLEWLVRLLTLSTTSKSLFKLDLINHRSSTQVASSTGSTPAVKARLRLAHQLLRPHFHFHRSTWHPWLRSRGSFQSYRRRPHSFCSTNWRRKLEVRLFILLLWPLRNLLPPVLSISNKRARGRNVMSSTFPLFQCLINVLIQEKFRR